MAIARTAACVVSALALLAMPSPGRLAAAAQAPAQPSLADWRARVLAAEADPGAARAQAVFGTLLRAWDHARIEPTLFVVTSAAGPWAASLADGNILLSAEAIAVCDRLGGDRADHLLAFVLAHELAHQRAADLWHHRFFRLAGDDGRVDRQVLRAELGLQTPRWSELQQIEARADHEGLAIMASVGFDPFAILDRQDFFSAWVENVWGQTCDLSRLQDAADGQVACREARSRALRARTQLEGIATQAVLYELGLQSFVAGDFGGARRYFTAYARDFPSRAVLAAIGLSHLAQAVALRGELLDRDELQGPALHFPLWLDATPAPRAAAAGQRRGVDLTPARRRLASIADRAVDLFERAVRLDPDHRGSLLLLANAYLAADNTPMARGILQGRYLPRFGADPAADLLLAMTLALEGRAEEAAQAFDALLAAPPEPGGGPLPGDLWLFAAFHNAAALALHRGRPEQAAGYWRDLAELARRQGRAGLFRFALQRLQPELSGAPRRPASIARARRGERPAAGWLAQAGQSRLWLEGEAHTLARDAAGARLLLDPDGRILHSWQNAGDGARLHGLAVGEAADRPLKVLGPPSRQFYLQLGEYLVYDAYGLAVHLVAGQVAGWFFFEPA